MMRKSYFLKYGTDKEKEEVRGIFNSCLDMEFVEHDSEYFGIYFLYGGLFADRFKIGDNFISDEQGWIDEKNKYKTLVNVCFTSGKNADKLSKCKHIKDVFRNHPALKEVVLLEEKCMEEAS